MRSTLARLDAGGGVRLLDDDVWRSTAPLGELADARHGGPPRDRTTVRAIAGREALHVLFECEDRDVWATHARRDAPLWEEEVVEVFLAPGGETPVRYVEIELSPAGTLFDAVVHNPEGRRARMAVDAAWNAVGLVGRVDRPQARLWRAELSIPWGCLAEIGEVAGACRANFYRVERPRDEPAEFTAWSPTGADPPDFHRPERFGHLVIP